MYTRKGIEGSTPSLSANCCNMTYFSRRNEYVTEYSGHEEASEALRTRLLFILGKYIRPRSTYSDRIPSSVTPNDLQYEVGKEFPGKSVDALLKLGQFHEVFTVIEIFLVLCEKIQSHRRIQAEEEIIEALQLSGSVYRLNGGRIELGIDQEMSEKIDSVKPILSSYPEFSHRFYQAVGNLLGRKAKAEDVVKDVFVAAEGYLKDKTGGSTFGDAIKELSKKQLITNEEKKTLEALYQFRSDADGAGHAGNSAAPTEHTALWFLDTLIAQLRTIDRAIKQNSGDQT
jgi:hypothetical protein